MKGTTASLVITAVVIIFSTGLNGAESAGYPKPSSCGRLECPAYRVVSTTKEFEIREYKTAVWMSTPPIKSISYDDAVNKGFAMLFSYISGNNVQKANIEMTAPVLVDIQPSDGPFCNSTFDVHFYVPLKFQSNPPKSAQVSPIKLPRTKYAAVRRFGGFMNQLSIATEAAALHDSLAGTAWKSAVSQKGVAKYSVAGYNSPFESSGRVNEVMFWFDGKK